MNWNIESTFQVIFNERSSLALSSAFSKIIIIIIIQLLQYYFGPRRMLWVRGGTRGVVRLGGLTHWSKCVFVSLLCKDIRTPILDVYFDGCCSRSCDFFSLEGSLDAVIWSFKHSPWKKLCFWPKSFRRFFWRVTASPPLDEALRCPLILYPFWARISTLTPPILYTLKVRLYQMYLVLRATLFCFVLWLWKWMVFACMKIWASRG